MKKFTSLLESKFINMPSLDSLTFSQLFGEVDFIDCDQNDFIDYKDVKLSNYRLHKLSDKFSCYIISEKRGSRYYEFIIICKNNDPLAIINGNGDVNYFGNIIIINNFEVIILYNTDDFTHKIIGLD